MKIISIADAKITLFSHILNIGPLKNMCMCVEFGEYVLVYEN